MGTRVTKTKFTTDEKNKTNHNKIQKTKFKKVGHFDNYWYKNDSIGHQ